MLTSLPRRLAMVLALAVATACSDDDDPTGPDNAMSFAEIVTECVEGTIGVVGDADVVESGTVDDADCYAQEFDDFYEGRIEGYAVPQASFGEWEALGIEVQADFDAVIVLLNEDGELIDYADNDVGDDLGHETYLLFADEQVDQPDYYVGVLSFEGEGDYSITFTGISALAARAP